MTISIDFSDIGKSKWDRVWVLRATKTTRLVFLARLIDDNQKDPEATVKGVLAYQRKLPGKPWEAPETINLAALKGGEGVRLDLDSAETRAFYKYLQERYGDDKSANLGRSLGEVSGASIEDLTSILVAGSTEMKDALGKLLSWATKLEDLEEVADQLAGLDQASLANLQAAVQLRTLIALRDQWDQNQDSDDEEFWQRQIASSPILLQQIFEAPVTVVKGKAYVGGKNVSNDGGKLADFLLKNSITQNLCLVEIKTPGSHLLGAEYRSGVFPLSREVMGAISQVLTYRDDLNKEFFALARRSKIDMESFDPCCVVVVGSAEKRLTSEERRRSFELARAQMRDVRIVTFDELYARLQSLIDLLRKAP